MHKQFLFWVGVLLLVGVGIVFAMPRSRCVALGYLQREPVMDFYPASYYIQALESPQAETRKQAAFALGQFGKEDGERGVPALAKALGDEDDLVRVNAALALYKIGPSARAAVPALVAALRDRVQLVRLDAAMALMRLGPDAHEAVPALVQAMADPENRPRMRIFERSIREQAVLTLGRIGPGAREAVPALRVALDDEDGHVRDLAARALYDIDRAALEEAAPGMARRIEGR